MKLEWTRTARGELYRAYRELSAQRPDAADAWIEDVTRMMEMIENHPAIGHRHRTSREGEYREVIVGRYRFIYRVAPDVLRIRRVIHVRRDYDPMRIREGFPPGWPAFAS